MYKKMMKSHLIEQDSKYTESTDNRASQPVWTLWDQMEQVNRELRIMLSGKHGLALVTDAVGVWKLKGYSNFLNSPGLHSQSGLCEWGFQG